jgi:NTE family protein
MKALVLSGGGARGAFQAGVLKRLIFQEDNRYDIFCGTSVGALNAAFLAQFADDEMEIGLTELIKMWSGLDKYKVYSSWPIFGIGLGVFKKSLYDASPLKALIKRNIHPENIEKVLRVVTSSLTTGDVTVFTEKDVGHILDAIYASAAVPGMFQPIQIGPEWFADGGIRDLSPISHAVDAGATEIHIINCSNLKVRPKDVSDYNSIKFFGRATEIMMNDILVSDLKVLNKINVEVEANLNQQKKYIRFKLIQPMQSTIMGSSLAFDHDEIMDMIDAGFHDSMDYYTDRTIHQLLNTL